MTERKLKILVVDDCPEDREVVRRYLADERFRLQEVATAEAGLRLLASEPFDCVLVDYELPDASGVQFLDEIPAYGRPAVVMVTGRGDEQTAVRSLKGGAQDYLVKGDFTRTRLERVVDAAVEMVAMRREIDGRRKELEQFAATTAHDLKAPLRRIGSLCQMVLNDAVECLEGESAENLRLIRDEVERMSRFVEDVLQLSVIVGTQSAREPVDLGRLLVDLEDAFRPALAEVGGELVHRGLPTVEGDRLLLRRLFQNLIDNAIKYRSERPLRIEIDAARGEQGWLVSVRDTGQGIPADSLERIFEMFCRLHGDCTAPGVGLGLTICQRVVERHRGRIWVESTPGAGSAFRVWLPSGEALS